MEKAIDRKNRFVGVILGTAVGDSVGLPTEGISARRIRKMHSGELRQRLIFGRGMVSDDTEHTVFVAQSLIVHPHSTTRFTKRLAWCFRLWLASLPAGVGLSTGRAIIRLWIGFPPYRSGVRSAGNGAAMRAAPIGAYFWDKPNELRMFVSASTKMTHTDERAEIGALAVASMVANSIERQDDSPPTVAQLIDSLSDLGTENSEWQQIVELIGQSLSERISVRAFAARLGLKKGVTGYVFHTVPVAIFAWHAHYGSFEDTLSEVIACGGDTDTTGAIAGALAGAVSGASGIPTRWKNRLKDWPRSTEKLSTIGERLFESSQTGISLAPVRYVWPAAILRNLVFLVIVLLHGFRRLFPPY